MSEKDAGMRIRVERELRDQFLEACREQDRPAARVIREFMRMYIRQSKASRRRNDKKQRGNALG